MSSSNGLHNRFAEVIPLPGAGESIAHLVGSAAELLGVDQRAIRLTQGVIQVFPLPLVTTKERPELHGFFSGGLTTTADISVSAWLLVSA